MAFTDYLWTVEQDPLVAAEEAAAAAAAAGDDTVVSPFDRSYAGVVGRNAHLGYGLLRPFRRDEKNDFANAGGLALVRASVAQVLGTRCSNDRIVGELPWNTEFGSLLPIMRHMANDDALQELARLYIVEALARWEPRVIVSRADISRSESEPGGGENVLEVLLVYDVIKEDVPGNQVLFPDVEQFLQFTV